MLTIKNVNPKHILFATYLLTAIFLFTRIDFYSAISSRHIYDAIEAYVTALIIALSPYSLLWLFISNKDILNLSKKISVVVIVGMQVIGYTFFYGKPTAGWGIFIVSFWQFIAIPVLYFTKILRFSKND